MVKHYTKNVITKQREGLKSAKREEKMNMTEKELTKMKEDFAKGIILSCPFCGRIDIDPRDHFLKCDPVFERYRQESFQHGYDK